MKNSFIFLILVVMGGRLLAQTPTPGNVGTANLTAWFKPNALPLGNVTTWTTTYPTGVNEITVTDAAAPYPTSTNTPVGNVSNYNRTVEFVNPATITSATAQALENSDPNLGIINNFSSTDEGTFFGAYYLPATTSNDHMVLYNSGNTGIQFRNLGATGRLAIGYNSFTSANATRNWNEAFLPEIISYRGNRSTFNSMDGYKSSALITTSSASQSGGATGLYFGARSTGVNSYTGNSGYNGFLHEFIFFNTDLTDLEMSKVHTYLSIKYGNTLDNAGGGTQGDYVATDGTIVWDASLTPNYHNDVIGIAREDDEAFTQKQSHAFDDSYRIYIDDLAATNDANQGAFNANISYVTMGSNIGDYCASTSATNEAPASILARFESEFKVTKTNFAQTFSWDVKIDSCTSLASIDMSKVRFLVDDDGDFTNATEYLDGANGLSFSYANGYLTIAGISDVHIPNNSTRYITFGYNEPEVDIVPDLNTICSGDSVQFTANIIGVAGPINFEYTDGTDTLTLTNMVDGDVFTVFPTVNTTYSVIDYENILKCCAAPGTGTNTTIVVNQRPVVSVFATDTVLCFGDTLSLSGQGANTYTWDNGVQDGVVFAPPSTQNYTLIGEDANTCLDTATFLVTVNPNPVVVANANQTTICVGDSILLSGTGAVNYTWDNGVVDNTYDAPTQTTTYELIGVNQFGCDDTTDITITVNNLPLVVANTTSPDICEGESVTLFGAGASIYQWDNNVIDNVSFAPVNSNMYHLLGTDVNGCENVDSVFVEVYPALSVSIGPDTIICPQDPISITTDSLFSGYLWSNGSTASTINSTYAGSYSVVVTDQYGCSYTDAMNVTFSDDCYPTLFVPNAFTPDGNEHNGSFRAYGYYIERFEMTIYDRWGNLVFKSNDIEASWDGYSSLGKPFKEGTYVYKIVYTIEDDEDKNYVQTGHVTLLR